MIDGLIDVCRLYRASDRIQCERSVQLFSPELHLYIPKASIASHSISQTSHSISAPFTFALSTSFIIVHSNRRVESCKEHLSRLTQSDPRIGIAGFSVSSVDDYASIRGLHSDSGEDSKDCSILAKSIHRFGSLQGVFVSIERSHGFVVDAVCMDEFTK